ncbi:polar amino acid transport system substrate-binding protein [Kaistia soli DSM 19436]|uniref:Polar amino acid transport system substrate-binding protein n=1 Tax=Kaistia soli DSM 19436 TaxID=1122133 RepID=A0A1M5IEI7_9HYPH|nr:ABC transporter substrate-binding protein [Kaistia soli]SHG26213.1 polar amino acid transport system substrate-binding protein [Kaistia soli DSM 19436]
MDFLAKRAGLVRILGAASLALMSAGAALAQTVTITPNMPATPDMVKHLPEAVKSRGALNVATTDGNAPWVFVDAASGEVKGVDADLVNEAAKRLGLKVKWDVIQFTAGIPGVESGRYDFYLSAMADTKKREDVVNFIAYSQEGSGVIVPKGNPLGIKVMDDLCGKRVAIVTGSLFPDLVEKLNKTCPSPVVLSETADQTGPYLAVASGQADATMNTYGVSNYTLKTATEGIQTQLELSPVPLFAPANQGIAFSKSQTDLMAAVGGAMQAMKEDGSYQKIMDKWNVGDGAVAAFTFNAPLF